MSLMSLRLIGAVGAASGLSVATPTLMRLMRLMSLMSRSRQARPPSRLPGGAASLSDSDSAELGGGLRKSNLRYDKGKRLGLRVPLTGRR